MSTPRLPGETRLYQKASFIGTVLERPLGARSHPMSADAPGLGA